jgi:crossover junction endodeoxyribonuclease RuvC
MSEVILGIDPGFSGALASVNLNGTLIEVWDMPIIETAHKGGKRREIDGYTVVDILSVVQPKEVVIEKVNAMPKQGVTSTFRLGEGFGILQGVCAGMGVPLTLIQPQGWKKSFGLGAIKDQSRQMASRTWPSMSKRFSLKKHDGRAEAALIALWKVRNLTT